MEYYYGICGCDVKYSPRFLDEVPHYLCKEGRSFYAYSFTLKYCYFLVAKAYNKAEDMGSGMGKGRYVSSHVYLL